MIANQSDVEKVNAGSFVDNETHYDKQAAATCVKNTIRRQLSSQGWPMHPLETYLRDLRDIRSTGAAVKETSFYPPLANLLNEVGKTLKPRVRCVINLRNLGAGMPDGGLFTPSQFQRGATIRSPGRNRSGARSNARGPKTTPG